MDIDVWKYLVGVLGGFVVFFLSNFFTASNKKDEKLEDSVKETQRELLRVIADTGEKQLKEMKSLNEKISATSEKTAVVENSVNTAHKRIDGIHNNLRDIESRQSKNEKLIVEIDAICKTKNGGCNNV